MALVAWTTSALGCGSSSSGFLPEDGDDASRASQVGEAGGPGANDDDATTSPGDDGSTGLFDPTDAGPRAIDDAGLCTLGSAANLATDQALDLFGNVVYYLDGGALPAGRYQVKYLDGCLKYDFVFNWSVNGGTPGTNGWFLVRNDTSDRIAQPPGTGFDGTSTAGGFANFDDCVAANKALAPTEFDFDGGKLGVWLSDSPYQDNVAGTNGRNPKWALTYLEKCPPNITPVPPK